MDPVEKEPGEPTDPRIPARNKASPHIIDRGLYDRYRLQHPSDILVEWLVPGIINIAIASLERFQKSDDILGPEFVEPIGWSHLYKVEKFPLSLVSSQQFKLGRPELWQAWGRLSMGCHYA